MGKQILVVDDDPLMRRSLSLQLEQAGYRTRTAADADSALALARTELPDLILLDIGLPDMDGLELLRQLRQEQDVPVIFVTARRRELDTILGLELGADDYITKPFNPDVLLAHVRAVLRRSGRAGGSKQRETAVIQVGDLIIDPAAHTVLVADRQVELTAREFDLLLTLARQAGNVLSIDQLLDRVWGEEFIGQPQAVYVHIRWLREKIEDDPQNPQRLVNVRGVGYKLVPQREDDHD
ncbi:MAG: response regulator transcription factor [Candidatus Promineifilaceae bacterium]|nr:response regulator transcription factor [Candidatus Promineifilaceae bacterium]